MNKRFTTGEVEYDFTGLRKLTWQKRMVEAHEDRIETETEHLWYLSSVGQNAGLSRRRSRVRVSQISHEEYVVPPR